MNEIMRRAKAPTPTFFKQLRNIGLILATIATAARALPAVVIKIAGYLTVAAGVRSAVSQTTVEGE